ncbi:MAG: cytochrome c biogenesis protein CcdA [Acidobacteriota bacterium]|nr:cytochrome c biogenesis protein CcdA [Acidobacteriota bacterium]
MKKIGNAIAVLLLFAVSGWAQLGHVDWTATGPDKAVNAGGKFSIQLAASISDGWHMYSITQAPGGPTRTVIKLPEANLFTLSGNISGPAPHKAYDKSFELETETYQGKASFVLPVVASAALPSGPHQVAVDATYQLCNDTTCIPPKTVHLFAPVNFVPAQGATPAAAAKSPTAVAPEAVSVAAPISSAPENAAATQSVTGSQSAPASGATAPGQTLGSFVWLAVVMGALSLLTPCVFPMIPITVSYFTNHAGKDRGTAIMTALVYGVGIILTFTALGMALAIVFGAGGVNQLAANPWINLLITAIFLALAFSLFGAYFIQVPPGLMNRINNLTRSKEGSGVIGALLMGFTFTLTSFTCTAPFVGTLLVMTAQGNWQWPLLGMLAFSTVFASPFVVLALAPQWMSKMPKAGGWMVSVKVVMGFLEIAAAMKFLSNADLVWRWGIFTRTTVLAVWIAIGVLTVLYILGYFRMEHEPPLESVGAVRIALAIAFLAIVVWLVPGLFGKPLGELEPFLPPDTTAPVSALPGAKPPAEAAWILNDYNSALAQAKQENKLVFVDFTGYTCTNCRWMEANMFPRPEVAQEMDKFVRVRLYTDGEGALFAGQQKLQQEKFGTVALPYYAIVRPDGSLVKAFPGLTRSAPEFVAFLASGQGRS